MLNDVLGALRDEELLGASFSLRGDFSVHYEDHPPRYSAGDFGWFRICFDPRGKERAAWFIHPSSVARVEFRDGTTMPIPVPCFIWGPRWVEVDMDTLPLVLTRAWILENYFA